MLLCQATLAHSALLMQSNKPSEFAKRWLAEINFSTVLSAVIAIGIAYGLLLAIDNFTDWISERVPRRFRLLTKQGLPFLRAFVLLVSIVYVSNLFLNLSARNLFALTGTLAVALGFAFKDYVSSIIAGVVGLYEVPYRVGDRVRIGETYGEITDYGLRRVQIRTPSDSLVSVPHSKIWTEPIINANSGDLEAQVVTNFYFSHAVDVAQTRQILCQTAYSSKYTRLDLPVVVIAQERPWGTQFKLKAYPMDARDEFLYQTDLIQRAKQYFADHAFEYPQSGYLQGPEGGAAVGE
ncbi:MAG: mechanosensitive ion channel family protein [Leptolyngbyaceae cyanobacterium SL_1_1]|nr:mechanosensitive ion channel family protein [Leptolyngbyaceae cyanobacterium RM1_1_2]NJO10939.1 mechanosensitive ion channel family protein [Leptolyngbyaceae cyanobacterium SL_1_1]